MRILMTGTSGFIGSQLLKVVINVYGKENVIALSSKVMNACQTIVYQSINNFQLTKSDIQLLASVELLIHAGAFTPKYAKDANTVDACNGNIFYTDQLLSMDMPKLKKIIFLSTIDVYADADFINELTPTMPASLYGQSKLYCEKMIEFFSKDKAISAQILRIGHVYGPGEEKYSKIIPNTIKKIKANQAVELWGDGSELRSFIYIDDVISAILKSVKLGDVGVINIVGGKTISIEELIELLISISGKPVEIKKITFNGVKRNLIFNNEKMTKNLLKSETELSKGLEIEFAHIEHSF